MLLSAVHTTKNIKHNQVFLQERKIHKGSTRFLAIYTCVPFHMKYSAQILFFTKYLTEIRIPSAFSMRNRAALESPECTVFFPWTIPSSATPQTIGPSVRRLFYNHHFRAVSNSSPRSPKNRAQK